MSSSDSSRYQPSGSLPLAQCSRPARLLTIITLCLPEAPAQTAPPRPCRRRSSPGSPRRSAPEGLHTSSFSPPPPPPPPGPAAPQRRTCRGAPPVLALPAEPRPASAHRRWRGRRPRLRPHGVLLHCHQLRSPQQRALSQHQGSFPGPPQQEREQNSGNGFFSYLLPSLPGSRCVRVASDVGSRLLGRRLSTRSGVSLPPCADALPSAPAGRAPLLARESCVFGCPRSLGLSVWRWARCCRARCGAAGVGAGRGKAAESAETLLRGEPRGRGSTALSPGSAEAAGGSPSVGRASAGSLGNLVLQPLVTTPPLVTTERQLEVLFDKVKQGPLQN